MTKRIWLVNRTDKSTILFPTLKEIRDTFKAGNIVVVSYDCIGWHHKSYYYNFFLYRDRIVIESFWVDKEF